MPVGADRGHRSGWRRAARASSRRAVCCVADGRVDRTWTVIRLHIPFAERRTSGWNRSPPLAARARACPMAPPRHRPGFVTYVFAGRGPVLRAQHHSRARGGLFVPPPRLHLPRRVLREALRHRHRGSHPGPRRARAILLPRLTASALVAEIAEGRRQGVRCHPPARRYVGAHRTVRARLPAIWGVPR